MFPVPPLNDICQADWLWAIKSTEEMYRKQGGQVGKVRQTGRKLLKLLNDAVLENAYPIWVITPISHICDPWHSFGGCLKIPHSDTQLFCGTTILCLIGQDGIRRSVLLLSNLITYLAKQNTPFLVSHVISNNKQNPFEALWYCDYLLERTLEDEKEFYLMHNSLVA